MSHKPLPMLFAIKENMSMRNFLLALALLFISFSVVGSETEPSLSRYPTPSQAIKDVAETSGQVKPEVLAGRQVGRLYMLATTLSYRHSSSGAISQAPAEYRSLHGAYLKAARKISEGIESRPEWKGKCGYIGGLLESCFRENFNWARTEFSKSPGAAADAASLYFPEASQKRFIDLADPHGFKDKYRSGKPEADRKRNLNVISIAAILIGLLGLLRSSVSAYRMGRRRFDSTSDAGVIHYGSYGGFVVDRLKAVWIALLFIASLFFLVAGIGIRIFI